MALQKKRRSKSKKRLKRSSYWLSPIGLSTCTNCGKSTSPHRACVHCGYYKGKPVITIKVKEKNKD